LEVRGTHASCLPPLVVLPKTCPRFLAKCGNNSMFGVGIYLESTVVLAADLSGLHILRPDSDSVIVTHPWPRIRKWFATPIDFSFIRQTHTIDESGKDTYPDVVWSFQTTQGKEIIAVIRNVVQNYVLEKQAKQKKKSSKCRVKQRERVLFEGRERESKSNSFTVSSI